MAHIFTPALRRPLSKPFARSGTRTLIQRAIASLRARGSDAHLWLPGVGTVNGLTTGNYLESTGNSIATVDNPTGLVLDALGTVGAELISDTGFDNPAYWVVTQPVSGASAVSGSALTLNTIDGSYTAAQRAGIAVAGKTYKYEVSFTSVTGYVSIAIGATLSSEITSAGIATGYITAISSAPLEVKRARSSVATTAVVSNISVREVSGIHAQQGTTANKPVLRRGAYNYLLNSVLAGGTSGVEGSGAVAPTNWAFGSATGSVTFSDGTARFVAASQRPFIGSANITLPVGSYIISARVVDGSYSLLAGAIGLVAVSAVVTATTYKKNNVTATGAESIAPGDVISALFSVTTAGTATMRVGLGCAGAATGDITLSQPQLELGSTASAYSPTTTAAASNPDAGKYSWQFDGSNDSLALGSVPFQMGDDHCVIAGFRADSAAKIVVIPGSNVSGHRIAAVMTNGVSGSARLSWWDGTNHNVLDSVSSIIGSTVVASGRKTGSALVARLNGSQFGTTTATATFTPDRGYIGMSDGGAFYHAGSIGPVITIKGTVTDAELLMYERLIAALTPNGPVF